VAGGLSSGIVVAGDSGAARAAAAEAPGWAFVVRYVASAVTSATPTASQCVAPAGRNEPSGSFADTATAAMAPIPVTSALRHVANRLTEKRSPASSTPCLCRDGTTTWRATRPPGRLAPGALGRSVRPRCGGAVHNCEESRVVAYWPVTMTFLPSSVGFCDSSVVRTRLDRAGTALPDFRAAVLARCRPGTRPGDGRSASTPLLAYGLPAASPPGQADSAAAPVVAVAAIGAHGKWDLLPFHSEVLAVHAVLLHTGKVLFAAGSGNGTIRFGPNFSNTAKKFWTSVVWDPTISSPPKRPG
jgi:hypothetical protein